MKNHALERFGRPPERMNCAEAVLYAYQTISGDTAIRSRDEAPWWWPITGRALWRPARGLHRSTRQGGEAKGAVC